MAENIYNDEDNDGAADSDGKWDRIFYFNRQ